MQRLSPGSVKGFAHAPAVLDIGCDYLSYAVVKCTHSALYAVVKSITVLSLVLAESLALAVSL